jgi:YVTN family beta-propeller protein
LDPSARVRAIREQALRTESLQLKRFVRRPRPAALFTAFAWLCAGAILTGPVRAGSPEVLRPVGKIELAGVKGRIDHFAVDLEGKRLLVAALGNDTVEVIDLATGKRLRTIEGLREPQGLAYLPDLRRLIAACGEGAAVTFFEGQSLKPLSRIGLRDDPDNVRYDAATKRIYVGCGTGNRAALAVLDAQTGGKVSDIALAGHPESFQLEQKGARAFVNVPSARELAVVNRAEGAVVAHWKLEGAIDNFPMALDENYGRLFVGCRRPAKLLVFDTSTGALVSSLDCVGDADDIACDTARRRVYVSGGEGYVSVFQQAPAGNRDGYDLLANIETAPGARTSILVPELNRFFVAVPARAGRAAEILAYEPVDR